MTSLECLKCFSLFFSSIYSRLYFMRLLKPKWKNFTFLYSFRMSSWCCPRRRFAMFFPGWILLHKRHNKAKLQPLQMSDFLEQSQLYGMDVWDWKMSRGWRIVGEFIAVAKLSQLDTNELFAILGTYFGRGTKWKTWHWGTYGKIWFYFTPLS